MVLVVLLNLLLVALHLVLQLVHQLLHPLMVLVVLLLRECQLLDASGGTTLRLFSLHKTALLIIELGLEVLDLLLQPGGDLPASLDSLLLSLVQLRLHVLDLALEGTAVLLAVLGVLLLASELISQTSGVNHRLLGLVLGDAALAQHLLQVSLQSLHLRVQLPLCCLERLVLQGAVRELLHNIRELLFCATSLPVRVLQLSLRLLQLVGNGMVLPLSLDQPLPGLVPHDLLFLKSHLGSLDLTLILLDGGLGLGVGSIGVLQGNAQLVHVGLQLLLLADRLALGTGFVLQRGLHGLNGLLVSLLQSIKLIRLLLDPPLDLLLHLGQLKLGPENLVLLLLQSALGFFKGRLKLQFFAFKALPDFVNLVDGSTTLTDLIHDVFDFSAQRLIFSPYSVKLTVGLIVVGLHLEQLR